MQILGLLGMYFDAVEVEVKSFLLLFRLALAILWVFFTLGWKVEFSDLAHFLGGNDQGLKRFENKPPLTSTLGFT